MAIFELIFAAILFVLSSGLMFGERFRKNPLLVGLAALIAIASSLFLMAEFPRLYQKITNSPSEANQASTSQTEPKELDPRSIELAYWESIRDSDNKEIYEDYLRKYPDGEFVVIARARLKSLNEADAAAEEASYWESIKDSDDEEAYKEYLRKYPNGRYSAEARGRLTDLDQRKQDVASETAAPETRMSDASPSESSDESQDAKDSGDKKCVIFNGREICE